MEHQTYSQHSDHMQRVHNRHHLHYSQMSWHCVLKQKPPSVHFLQDNTATQTSFGCQCNSLNPPGSTSTIPTAMVDAAGNIVESIIPIFASSFVFQRLHCNTIDRYCILVIVQNKNLLRVMQFENKWIITTKRPQIRYKKLQS